MAGISDVQLAQDQRDGTCYLLDGADQHAPHTHVVIIPSYNSGAKLLETVIEARRHWSPVWVVIDGSTDDSRAAVERLAAIDAKLRVFVLPFNRGKGAAILHGLRYAEAAGFTHALTMDGDGQHPAALIPRFVAESLAHPDALILGMPVFDRSAPLIRILGRKVSNLWTRIETLWVSDFDSLFGFRVYPITELRMVLEASRWMRRFDFDAEAVVRLYWRGYKLISLPAPVRYFAREHGGVSHFRYVRDNMLLAWMHARLLVSFVRNLRRLTAQRFRSLHR